MDATPTLPVIAERVGVLRTDVDAIDGRLTRLERLRWQLTGAAAAAAAIGSFAATLLSALRR